MSIDRVEELFDESHDLPDGPVRVAVLEEAAREADRLSHEDWSFRTRWNLVTAAGNSGSWDKALAAFAWCLGHADRCGDDFEYTPGLLRRYQWTAHSVTYFPDVSRSRIRELEDDFERRTDASGFGRSASIGIRWMNAICLGEEHAAVGAFRRWRESPHDELSCCEACIRNLCVSYHSAVQDDERVLAAAEPILSGELSCDGNVPHTTYASLLMPLARLGRVDEADRLHELGYQLVCRGRGYADVVALHLHYLVRRAQWDRALRVFERHLPWRSETNVPRTAFCLDLAALMLFEKLGELDDRPRRLRLPEEFGGLSGEECRPSDLADVFAPRVTSLARRFDRRNGNDAYRGWIAEMREFTRLGR